MDQTSVELSATQVGTRGPVEDPDRIVPIDVLRGFALLGVLVMNIQSFAMVGSAYMNPTSFGDLTGANYWVWYLSHLLADQKMMTIFSMLFGAGIVLMTGRCETATGRSAAVHYRRMGVLLGFGVLHGYLLWFGDILYSYAMCGFVAYMFRKVRPSLLVLLGCLSLAVPSILSLLLGWSMQFWPPEDLDSFRRDAWQPTSEMIAEEVAAYRGGWWTEIVHRAPTTLAVQTLLFAFVFAWRAGGLMLVGMALFKLGVFSATRSKRTYVAMIAAAVAVGIPTIMLGIHRNVEAGWSVEYSFFFGEQFNYWGSLLVSGGWVGTVMLVCRNPAWLRLAWPLAAVGRMALSNYLIHTVIATTIFYGRGFGMFGEVSRVGQLGIVLAIWTLQLIVSPIWLHYFQFGPAEWLWRSLTYLKLPPIRRTDA